MTGNGPKSVVVVGMPRSGTSMVAGIFARHGYFAAEDPDDNLRAGDHNNPGGYWEAESLTRANAEVFAAVGYPEHNSWLGAPAPHDLVGRVRSVPPSEGHRALVAAYESRAPWMWKDPRLCYTLGYWWPLLSQESTRVVLTRRDPEAIWQSFVRLRWREPTPEARADVMARIEAHLAAAVTTVESMRIQHIQVAYEDFAADPDGVARRISEFLELDLGAGDLGFSSKLDHSSLRGRVATSVDRLYERLPTPLRTVAKRLAPRSLLRVLFPERRSGG